MGDGPNARNPEPETFTSFDIFNFYCNHRAPDYRWTVGNMREVVGYDFAVDMRTSRALPWADYPQVEARPRISSNSSGMFTMSLDISPVGDLPLSLDIAPVPTVFYVLRDRRASSAPAHLVRTYASLSPLIFNFLMRFPRSLCTKDFLKSCLLEGDNVGIIDVYVEPAQMAGRVHSTDGILNWTIANFQEQKVVERLGLVERVESPYFYSSQGGYRMQMWLRSIGSSQESTGLVVVVQGLRVDLAFLSGEFDGNLPFSFRHRVTVTVKNPAMPDVSVMETADGDTAVNRVTRMFIPTLNSNLTDGQSLLVKVVVERIP